MAARAPWSGWAFVFGVVLLFFSVYRVSTLTSLITMYGTLKDCSLDVEIGALILGALQDSVCATYLCTALWIVDYWLRQRRLRCQQLGRVDSNVNGVIDVEDVQKPLDLRQRRQQQRQHPQAEGALLTLSELSA